MGQDFLKYLPSEITIDILSRLPLQTIISCKLVCKPWLDRLTTLEFVKSHLSKSVPCLATFQPELVSKPYKIIEFANQLDLTSDEHRLFKTYNFDIPFRGSLISSANGLLLQKQKRDIFLCNPLTCEYITLLSPPSSTSMLQLEYYGFGVSKTSGQYKVIRMFIEGPPLNDQYGCHVYTIGTRLWRRIVLDSPPTLIGMKGVFLNGNLHWLENKGSSYRIRSFDLETRLFSSFSAPRRDCPLSLGRLCVLGDYLCVCDSSINKPESYYEISIWLLTEYNDEKSWIKEFIIKFSTQYLFPCYFHPIKVFKDGGILIEWAYGEILCYSMKAQTTQQVDQFKSARFDSLCITTLSFLPLKTFAMENVSSY